MCIYRYCHSDINKVSIAVTEKDRPFGLSGCRIRLLCRQEALRPRRRKDFDPAQDPGCLRDHDDLEMGGSAAQ